MLPKEIVFTFFFIVLTVINLLGNGVVCLVVLRYRGMQAPINYLLVNLASADMMVALAVACEYVIPWIYRHPYGTSGDYICKFLTGGNFIWIGGVASGFSLTVIAVERYLAIVRSVRDRSRLTALPLTAVIIIGWILAVIFNLPLFFVVKRHKDRGNHCIDHWHPHKNLGKAFAVACFFVYGATPIITMVIMYSRVLCKLWKSGIHATLLSEQARIRSKRKVTKMVIMVSILYAICWLPNSVIFILSKFTPDQLGHGSYNFTTPYIISVVLVALNSTMNPFIYALHSTNFRRHIKGALCCRAAEFVNTYNVM